MKTDITHHLTDDLLMAYSAGNLPEAFSLVVATHVSMCDSCRARLESFDIVGGTLLESNETVQMSDAALGSVLAQISSSPKSAEPIQHSAKRAGLFPTPLHDYVGGDLESVGWRPIGMGVRQAILPTSRSARVRLLSIPAGRAMPDHGHRGTELTLVLKGAFFDGETRFGPGDVEVANAELEHTPVADIAEECICLAATDAPLQFRNLIPSIAQHFFRI